MAEESDFQGASAGSAHSSRDKAFEIFVKRTITSIQKEAWGRSKEVKDIREACQNFLNTLDQNGCTEETLKQVLYPLQLACSSSITKVVELALGCLHKLVAHAWLHGESTPSGTMDMLSAHGSLDDDDTVANVIKMVMKCGETTNEALQLAVVRALLTFTTAEHFIAHGECLLAAVRAVFNLALGSENPINKRTACNALLQMLNTICKRVTQIQPRLTGDSVCSSRATSDAFEVFRSNSNASFAQQSPKNSMRGSGTGASGLGLLSPTAAAAEVGGSNNSSHHNGSSNALFSATGGSGYLSTAAGQQQLLQYEIEAAAAAAAGGAATARAAQLAQLAEQKDLQGLEAALEAVQAADAEEDDDSSGPEESDYSAAAAAAAAAVSAGLSAGHAVDANGSEATAAGDNGAVETVSSVGPPPAGPPPSSYQQYSSSVPATPRAPATPSGRHGRHGKLTVQDKDVLLVLTAFCKLASREAPGNSSDSVLAQGKLLALEMLAKVLSNPFHNWEHIPENFCKQLRQPLCLALLRNCAASDPVAYALALRLLMAILCLPRLRMGLRAELGAFYPLLVLRCLEQQQPEQANVQAALGALQGLLAEPQLLVDLYVNFDCDLQASNLYERTVQVLSKLAQSYDSDGDAAKASKSSPEAAATAAGICKEALSCCLQVIAALESWAKPIKDAALRAADTEVNPTRQSTAQGTGFSSLPSMERERNDSSNSLSSSTSTSTKGLSEAERLAAAKNTKELMARGINLFNSKGALKGVEFLMSQGLLESSPAAVTSFLRNQHDQLDNAQLGELLGHHEDFAIAVMHAWVDSEPSMAGQAIDQALRKLLGGFRLPGEAQKIDRIMEKFAERYCKDNPGRFGNADAAYVLSFAVIMLNTDAHNPLAERRLAKADFVAMNHQQTEDGLMVPVLPVQQLEDIYDRVVKDEILVRGESSSKDFASSRTSTRNRLAAAMGWTSLLQPFRALAGNNSSKGGKDASAQAHRRYLQEMAEKEVVRAAASGNIWCSASHPEHVRPMLQVGGPMLLQALSAAFTAAPDAATAAPVLAGLLQLAKLFGLLGLDRQCESCVGALAARCGVFDPAAVGSPAEAKQLAALQALLGLTAGPEAGFLGSSWVIILRCVSALDALKQELTRPLPVPAAPANKEAGSSNPFSRMFQSMFGTGTVSSSTAASPAGSAGGSEAAGNGRISLPSGLDVSGEVARDSLDGSKRPTIRDAPGAGLVMWAESATGAVELERPYARSASLDGDAVVIFMRALCAISQEELESGSSSTSGPTAADADRAVSPVPAGHAGGPRLFSLQKVVECAYQNMGRIRLVWAKLWAVIAAQLVGASCHPHRRVALYAVDSLRQLVAKLLARAELEHFTHQEDALRPFVAVLRQCDEACVRELAVQCVMQAVTSHPRGLGSGWRMVILALRLGAADSSPAVMAQTQEALQVVVDTLYTGNNAAGSTSVHGHTFLRETVQAIVAGIRNPAHLELSVSAVQLLGRCGQQLAAYEDAGGRDAAPAGAGVTGGIDLDGDYGWGLLLRTLADVLQHDRRPQVVDAALEMLFALLAHYSQRWDAAAWRVLIQRVLQHMLALPPHLGTAYNQVPATAGAGGLDAAAGKGRTAASFSGFAPQVAAAAAASRGAGSGPSGLSTAAAAGGGGGGGGAVPAGMSAAEQGMLMTTMLQRMDRYYPMLCEQAALIRAEYKVELVQQLASIGVSWYQQTSIYLSTAGIKALMRLADTIAQITTSKSSSSSTATGQSCSWSLLLDPVAAAVKDDVDLVIRLATKQINETAEQQQQQQEPPSSRLARVTAAGSGSPSGSPRANRSVTNVSNGSISGSVGSPLGPKGGAAARQAVAAAAEKQIAAVQLRVRTQQLVLMQRALAAVHQSCKDSMRWDEQMQLLEVLAHGVDAAIAFNAGMGVTYWQQQQQSGVLATVAASPAVAGRSAAEPQQQQVQAQQLKQEQQQQQLGPLCEEAVAAAEEPEQQTERSGSTMLLESVDLASAVSGTSSISFSGLALGGFGSYVQPPNATSSGGEGGTAGPGQAVVSATAAAAAGLDAASSSGDGGAASGSAATSSSGAGASSGAGSHVTIGDKVQAADSHAASDADQQQQQELRQVDLAPIRIQPDSSQQQQQQQQVTVNASSVPSVAAISKPPHTSSGSSSSSSPVKRLSGSGTAQPGSPGRTRMAGVKLPVLLVSSPESVEEVHPAMMRLEAEGGLLLIEALNLSLQSCTLQTPATARAHQRLLQLVRSIIKSEAACSTTAAAPAAAAAAALSRYGSTAVSTLGSSSSSSTVVDNPLQDALAGVGWEHAARAPLVVAALKILSGLHNADYQREVVQLFPALCRLMCSNHMLTRIALHQVISSQQFLRLLPSAKGMQQVESPERPAAPQQPQDALLVEKNLL